MENQTATITLDELQQCGSHLHILIHGIENLQQTCIENDENGKADIAEVDFWKLCIFLRHLQKIEAIMMSKQLEIIDGLDDVSIPPHTHTIADGQHCITKGGKA